MKQPKHRHHFTIMEAAQELDITRAAVHRAIKQGRLEANAATLSA